MNPMGNKRIARGVLPARASKSRATLATPESNPGYAGLALENVLIVDDHPGFCMIMEEVVKNAVDCKAIHVEHNLPGALAYAARADPDLVLLDLGLRGCNDLDALLRFRERFARPTIIVVSARDDIACIHAAMGSGA